MVEMELFVPQYLAQTDYGPYDYSVWI